MASSKSAKKRIRQNIVSRDRNNARRSALKTQVKKFLDAVHLKDADSCKTEYHVVARMLDKTAAKGVLHKKTAARRKSRLAVRLNAVLAGG